MPARYPHDHCLARQHSMPTAGLVATVGLPTLAQVDPHLAVPSVSVAGRVGWTHYASRAPPLFAG